MTTPTCGQCGKPTPAGSIHTCSPQQPREWVTYEVQDYWNGKWRPVNTLVESTDAAMHMRGVFKRLRKDTPVRAVRIRHTEEVIG